MAPPSRSRPRASSAPSATVEILIKDSGWKKILPEASTLARSIIDAALKTSAVRNRISASHINVSLCLADDDEVRALNQTFRGKDAPTNVLSFPSDEREFLGDIILARGVVMAEAKAQGKTAADHAAHLLLHGFLHLAGFSHERHKDAALMEKCEAGILKKFGIADPYRARNL